MSDDKPYCTPCGNEMGWPVRYVGVTREPCHQCGTDGINHINERSKPIMSDDVLAKLEAVCAEPRPDDVLAVSVNRKLWLTYGDLRHLLTLARKSFSEDDVERCAYAQAKVIAERHGHEPEDWLNDQRREEARACLTAFTTSSS